VPQDIKERRFNFVLRIVKLSELLTTSHSEKILANQLLEPGISIGANVAEAKVVYSREDFAFNNERCTKRSTRDSLLVTYD